MKRLRLVLLACFIVLPSGSLYAHISGPCEDLHVRPYAEHPPIYIHETPYFKWMAKRWSTSDELKKHFDYQRKLFKAIGDMPVPTGKDALKLASVGDIMRVPSHQSDFVHSGLKQYLDSVDLLTGNLETLISAKYPVPPENLFMMNSDPSVLTSFRNASDQNYFSVLSLANNHTFDFPDDAIKDTLALLGSENIKQSGLRESERQKPYVIMEKNGVRLGYYAITTFVNKTEIYDKSQYHLTPMLQGIEPIFYAKWKNGCEIDLSDTEKVFKQMKDDGVDFIVLSIHWGLEHDMYPHPQLLYLARQLVSQGADIIIGSHPHTPQPSEICFLNGYEKTIDTPNIDLESAESCLLETADGKPRKALIHYSLGNFNSYTSIFWQQIGMISELTLVKGVEQDQSTSDWFSPKYFFTYDQVEHPPHGQQHLSLLDHYMENGCGKNVCSSETKTLVDALYRHLYGESLSLWEEISLSALGTYTFFKESIHWLLSPDS